MARQRPDQRDPRDLSGLRAALYCRVSRDSSGEEKSVNDQEAEARRWAGRADVTIVSVYRDVSLSASEYATKDRPGYQQLLCAIEAGEADLVWFWALNRATRQAREYIDLAALCERLGVRWVIGGKVYDLSDDDDTLGLDIHNMMDKRYSRKLSKDLKRGKESSANNGKRAGRFPYGYKRGKLIDADTMTFGPDQPDVFDGDGVAVQDSPAAVVREIFERVNGGESVTAIRKSLNDRGLRTKRGALWANSTVRYIAMNPAYAGMRVRHIGKGGELSKRSGNILEGPDGKPLKTKWPALVTEETFWTSYRILANPDRLKSKPHRPGGRLLAGVARCGECGCKLTTRLANSRQHQRADMYACREKACVGIYQPDLDAYVEKVMKAWLSDDRTAAALQRGGDEAALELARGDAEKARAELADWRRDAERGEVTLAGYKAFEKGALARIADAEERENAASVPPILRGRIGPAAAAGWDALDLSVRRQMIAAVADIRLRRVGRHGSRLIPAADRVEWHWLIGDAPAVVSEPAADVAERIAEAEAARLAERCGKVMHLRERGLSRAEIAAKLGMTVATVKRDIDAARPDGPSPSRRSSRDGAEVSQSRSVT